MGVVEGRILSGEGERALTYRTGVRERGSPVVTIGPSALPAAIAVLADAFADAPLTRCVVGGSRARRVRSTRLGLRAQLPGALARATVLGDAAAPLAGVLIGAPPFAHPFPAPPLARRLVTAFGQGFGVAGGWAELFERLVARRPAAPHFYLALLGVAPAHQRRGIGARLLRAWLAEVDAARASAWLETDEPRSLGLYRAAGFEVAGEIAFRSVPIWLLARGARGG
jgi:ribosomal protein S18 acetylase RimI-like enzyme